MALPYSPCAVVREPCFYLPNQFQEQSAENKQYGCARHGYCPASLSPGSQVARDVTWSFGGSQGCRVGRAGRAGSRVSCAWITSPSHKPESPESTAPAGDGWALPCGLVWKGYGFLDKLGPKGCLSSEEAWPAPSPSTHMPTMPLPLTTSTTSLFPKSHFPPPHLAPAPKPWPPHPSRHPPPGWLTTGLSPLALL